MRVTKAVIPCAGMGTRFLPFTKAVPKELIPIIDKPALQYIVEEVVASGITDILIIDSSKKTAIEKHFTGDLKQEELLRSRGKDEYADIIHNLGQIANITYAKQEVPSGSAGAVKLAKEFANNEPFALLFGDDLIYYQNKPPVAQLVEAYEKYQKTVIGVQPVLKENIVKYGSISFTEKKENVYFIDDIIEKPKFEEAPSYVAALGRYIVDPIVFEYIEKTSIGVGNELGITDTFQIMTKDNLCIACEYEGRRYDTGNKSSYLEAIVEYALRRDDLKDNFKNYLANIVKKF